MSCDRARDGLAQIPAFFRCGSVRQMDRHSERVMVPVDIHGLLKLRGCQCRESWDVVLDSSSVDLCVRDHVAVRRTDPIAQVQRGWWDAVVRPSFRVCLVPGLSRRGRLRLRGRQHEGGEIVEVIEVIGHQLDSIRIIARIIVTIARANRLELDTVFLAFLQTVSVVADVCGRAELSRRTAKFESAPKYSECARRMALWTLKV